MCQLSLKVVQLKFIPIDWSSTGHMLWYQQGVCKYDNRENRVQGKTLAECKAMCLGTAGCNAIHWSRDRLECPNPTPSPTQE